MTFIWVYQGQYAFSSLAHTHIEPTKLLFVPPVKPSRIPSSPNPGTYKSSPSARSVNPAESCRPPSVIFLQTPSSPAVFPSDKDSTALFEKPGNVNSTKLFK